MGSNKEQIFIDSDLCAIKLYAVLYGDQ